jgi:hypothetical protein
MTSNGTIVKQSSNVKIVEYPGYTRRRYTLEYRLPDGRERYVEYIPERHGLTVAIDTAIKDGCVDRDDLEAML